MSQAPTHSHAAKSCIINIGLAFVLLSTAQQVSCHTVKRGPYFPNRGGGGRAPQVLGVPNLGRRLFPGCSLSEYGHSFGMLYIMHYFIPGIQHVTPDEQALSVSEQVQIMLVNAVKIRSP